MDVFTALKMVKVNHQPLNHLNVVITDPTGKPDATLTELLKDVLSKLAIFGDIDTATAPLELINQLHGCTPLPMDVLEEYRKILEQDIESVNFATRKELVELVYRPLV